MMATWNEKQIQNLKFTAIRDLLGESGQFSINSNGEVEFIDGSKTCTDLEISNRMEEIIQEFNNTEYQRLRKAEYDKLNQDEMRFDDLVNGTTTWQDAILEIKSKYPKPITIT